MDKTMAFRMKQKPTKPQRKTEEIKLDIDCASTLAGIIAYFDSYDPKDVKIESHGSWDSIEYYFLYDQNINYFLVSILRKRDL